MPEYIANLMEARHAYASHMEAENSDIPAYYETRARAFDRMIREVQDEAFEEGYNQRGWEGDGFP